MYCEIMNDPTAKPALEQQQIIPIIISIMLLSALQFIRYRFICDAVINKNFCWFPCEPSSYSKLDDF